MGVFVMAQGDSYPIPIDLEQDGTDLTPDMIAEVEVCVGESRRYLASQGTVTYDPQLPGWYIRPSQQETISMKPGAHKVTVRVKYLNTPEADVKADFAGKLVILKTNCKEVI